MLMDFIAEHKVRHTRAAMLQTHLWRRESVVKGTRAVESTESHICKFCTHTHINATAPITRHTAHMHTIQPHAASARAYTPA